MDGLTKSIVIWRNRRSTNSEQYKTMTVQFQVTQTPGYGTYLDDAVNMPYGKTTEAISAWQEFFGYKPCLFKDGQVVGYLNPNDYSKFENGTSADIYSGNSGDVMVEFPRRGIKISKSTVGSVETVSVSITNEPDVPGFSYLAHTNGDYTRDYFYLGAYLTYKTEDYMVHSISGCVPSSGSALQFSSLGKNKGYRYGNIGFYQWLYIQCMYLLQFKGNLDSQTMVGDGFVLCYYGADAGGMTGASDTKGLVYGRTTAVPSTSDDHVKLFGLEDVWGNYYTSISNCNYHHGLKTISISTDGSTFITSDYSLSTGKAGYSIKSAICTNEYGFLPVDTNTTKNTYLSDSYFVQHEKYGNKYYNMPSVGGSYRTSGTGSTIKWSAGLFHIKFAQEGADDGSYMSYSTEDSGRLMYL